MSCLLRSMPRTDGALPKNCCTPQKLFTIALQMNLLKFVIYFRTILLTKFMIWNGQSLLVQPHWLYLYFMTQFTPAHSSTCCLLSHSLRSIKSSHQSNLKLLQLTIYPHRSSNHVLWSSPNSSVRWPICLSPRESSHPCSRPHQSLHYSRSPVLMRTLLQILDQFQISITSLKYWNVFFYLACNLKFLAQLISIIYSLLTGHSTQLKLLFYSALITSTGLLTIVNPHFSSHLI